MPGYETKTENIVVTGADNLQIRSLLDRQQFSDPLDAALRMGISSAAWPLFGLPWPSGNQLAQRMAVRALTAGEHRLRFECVGKAADADAFHLGLDRVTLRVPVYRRPAGADLRELQAK